MKWKRVLFESETNWFCAKELEYYDVDYFETKDTNGTSQ
jgi:hypothetical protein